ncbi:LOW QUALITY PROTEIN: protein SpAN-like, partial [Homarus americanus]|uniref:LOW QUALITY PROTEIN: protein SpAN-like n=1 Tax=Homarus americanus TaxID=6706 RepID=UPI001C436EFF
MVGSLLLCSLALISSSFAQLQPADELTPDHQEAGDLYQHDIMLTPEQKAILQGQVRGQANLIFRWPEGNDGYPLVPYQFIDGVDEASVTAGIQHWESKTCIKFEQRQGTTDPHIKFEVLSGCWSYIGYLGWHADHVNGQTVSIGSGCSSLGVVTHEIGHAIGLFHMQSSPARDDFVLVLYDNILDGKSSNFDKQTVQQTNYHGVPYDYTSNMHYSSFGFSKNGKMTIATTDPNDQGLIGQRTGLSHRDALLVNRMYSCIREKMNDGYLGPSCTCVCPRGTSGTHCDQITGGYYEELRDDCSQNVTAEGTITSPNYPGNYPAQTCATWIIAPECKAPTITFTAFDVPCGDKLIISTVDRYSGPSNCGDQITSGQTFTASTNEMVLQFFAASTSHTGWSANLTFTDIVDCVNEKNATTTTTATTTNLQQLPTTNPTTTTTTTNPTTTTTTTNPTTTTTTTNPTTTTTTTNPTTTTTTTTTTTNPTTTTTTTNPTTTTTTTNPTTTITATNPTTATTTIPATTTTTTIPATTTTTTTTT